MYKKMPYLCAAFRERGRDGERKILIRKRTKIPQKNRAVSSVGSEHLVYTQRVGGSNPSPPTN